MKAQEASFHVVSFRTPVVDGEEKGLVQRRQLRVSK